MKRKPVSAPSVKQGSLEDQALSQLNSGKYKEAIQLYKKLRQESEKDEWEQQLAHCYLQRAFSFADREMYKEALVLWDNYSQHAKPPFEAIDQQIIWLIQTKNKSKIQFCLQQLTVEQLDKQYPALSALLGLLILTEHPEFQHYLPEESNLIKHYKVVQLALTAYQESNLTKLNETLQQLPYRSAFRDFRTLLNAAIASQSSMDKMQALLIKIPENSPYSRAAKLMQACSLQGSELTQDLIQFSHKQQKAVGNIKQFNKKQLQLIEQLTRHNNQLSDKIKFNLAIKFQDIIGSELAQQFCQFLLLSYPAGRKEYKKHFAKGDSSEDARLKALTYEADNNFYDAEQYWLRCAALLSEQEKPDCGLKIALIMRHVASWLPVTDETLLIIDSLKHDPEDRSSYLKILTNYAQENEKDYQQWLDKTLNKFPKDIEVLSLVIQAAINNKAYKKATQYAEKILKIDSLNTHAKQTLFSCHLAHAKGLIKNKKFNLVEQEIQQAKALKIDKRHVTQTQLIQGLYCFAALDKKQGLQLIVESIEQLNLDPVNAHFKAAMEVLLTGLPVATILRELPACKDCLLSSTELALLVKSIDHYAEQKGNQELLHKALGKIKPALKKSIQQQDYSEEQLMTVCQTMSDIAHYELMRYCAKHSFEYWINPISSYYLVYAETLGDPTQCTLKQLLQLQSNYEQARKNEDHRAAVLIESYLDRYYQANPDRGTELIEDIFSENDDERDPVIDLFGHLSDAVFDKIDKKIQSLLKKLPPEKLASSFTTDSKKNHQIFQMMMQDPDLFTVLMVMKAADQLRIDVDVTVDDVLDYFKIGEQAVTPFPFPF